jgi:hypothetical protein
MKTIKNANNMLEILDEEGKVVCRVLKTADQQEAIEALLNSEEYQVIDFDVDVVMPEQPIDGDWRNSIIQ